MFGKLFKKAKKVVKPIVEQVVKTQITKGGLKTLPKSPEQLVAIAGGTQQQPQAAQPTPSDAARQVLAQLTPQQRAQLRLLLSRILGR